MPFKNSNETFFVIFKQCGTAETFFFFRSQAVLLWPKVGKMFGFHLQWLSGEFEPICQPVRLWKSLHLWFIWRKQKRKKWCDGRYCHWHHCVGCGHHRGFTGFEVLLHYPRKQWKLSDFSKCLKRNIPNCFHFPSTILWKSHFSIRKYYINIIIGIENSKHGVWKSNKKSRSTLLHFEWTKVH